MIHDGPKVVMGGTEWVVPPLTLKSLRKFLPSLGQIQTGALPMEQHFDLVRDIVHASLTRNYPELTADQLEDLLDTRNLNEILLVVLKASGLVKASVGEA